MAEPKMNEKVMSAGEQFPLQNPSAASQEQAVIYADPKTFEMGGGNGNRKVYERGNLVNGGQIPPGAFTQGVDPSLSRKIIDKILDMIGKFFKKLFGRPDRHNVLTEKDKEMLSSMIHKYAKEANLKEGNVETFLNGRSFKEIWPDGEKSNRVIAQIVQQGVLQGVHLKEEDVKEFLIKQMTENNAIKPDDMDKYKQEFLDDYKTMIANHPAHQKPVPDNMNNAQ